MTSDLESKTDQYESLLAEALEVATVAEDLPDQQSEAAEQCLEMAESYLRDGRHFRDTDDLPDALAAFSYGHGWLDAGARVGVLDVPSEGHLFTQ
ncbi:DUF357 domain-containing protein [Salinarchaeum chitinilyticum]